MHCQGDRECFFRVGLGVLESMLGPILPPDASLFGSGVPLDSPLEGNSLGGLSHVWLGQEVSMFSILSG